MQIRKERRMFFEMSTIFFRVVQGGTSMLERYTARHKNSTVPMLFQCRLPIAARTKDAQAAAMSFCLDIRPSSFSYEIMGCVTSLKPSLK